MCWSKGPQPEVVGFYDRAVSTQGKALDWSSPGYPNLLCQSAVTFSQVYKYGLREPNPMGGGTQFPQNRDVVRDTPLPPSPAKDGSSASISVPSSNVTTLGLSCSPGQPVSPLLRLAVTPLPYSRHGVRSPSPPAAVLFWVPELGRPSGPSPFLKSQRSTSYLIP